VLRRGDFRLAAADDGAGWLAFARTLGDERAVLVLNASPQSAQVRIPLVPAGLHEGQVLKGALGGASHQAKGGLLELALPALGFEILLSDTAD
jgi:hypothetical protein